MTEHDVIRRALAKYNRRETVEEVEAELARRGGSVDRSKSWRFDMEVIMAANAVAAQKQQG